ncbi:MAG: hypothetical protein ABFD90_18375 [Phycisphaerales bacterium]
MAKGRAARRWRFVLVALSATGILAGYLTAKLIRFVTGRPTISVDYAAEYNERMRPIGLDPNANAAPYYKDAFARLPDMPDDVFRVGRLWECEPNSIQLKAVKAWLASSDEALQLVQQAARKPAFWVERSTIAFNDPASMAGPDFARFRGALLGLRCKAEFRAMKGDASGAWDCILTICRMARHMEAGGRMEINLGQTAETLAYLSAFDLLSRTDTDSSLLREVQRQFDEISANKPPLSFQGDEILLRDAMQRYFTDNGKGDGHLVPGAIYDDSRRRNTPANELAANATYLRLLFTAWVHPSRQRTARALAYVVESAGQLLAKTPWELHTRDKSHADWLKGITKGNYFLRILTVDETLARTIEGFHCIRASGEALVTTMGILRFTKDNGRRPQSLEELVAAGYIRQVPIDPFSGKPLAFRQVDDSFTLYSYGRDFDDDGGTRSAWGNPPEGGDQVFWPVQERKK